MLARDRALPDERLKLPGHSSPLSIVVLLGHETRRFQPAGHWAGSLAANRWAAEVTFQDLGNLHPHRIPPKRG